MRGWLGIRRCGWRGVALALLVALAAAPAASETTLHARLNSDILSTDPGTRRDENTDAVLMHVVEGLVAEREDGSVGPLLAQSWTVSDDGRTYRFVLRQGVRFHNGQPLTADDVVWSLRRYLDPATHWRCRPELIDGEIAKILSVREADPAAVVITLDRPAPLFLQTLARPDCGGTGIVHRDSVDAEGKWIAPIGTGPFAFTEWQRNQYVELTRFADYAALPGPRDGNTGGKAALVDKVRFLVIPDGSAALAALMRGSLDVLDGLNPTDLATVRTRPDIRLEIAPTLDFYAVLFQTDDPLLRDVRLRRAIALTIDTPGLAKAVTWSTGKADNSPVPAVSPYYGPAEARFREPDLAAARRLAAEAGYRGQPIRLLTNRRYAMAFDAAVLVQAMAAQAGIHFEIETLDWATQLDRYAHGSYQAMLFGYSALPDPSLNFSRLVGDKAREPRKIWDTPEARSLLQASVETAPPGRQAVFDRLNAAFLEDVPGIALFNSARIAALRPGVGSYRSWPGALQRLWGVSLN